MFLILAGIILFTTVSIIGNIWQGYVLSILWGWFIVPVFGLPVLGVVPAIGVALVASYLSNQYHRNTDDRELTQQLADILMYSLSYPAIVLFVGWLVSMFI